MWNLHLKVLDHLRFIFLSFLKQMFDFSRKSDLQEFAINSWNSSFLEKKNFEIWSQIFLEKRWLASFWNLKMLVSKVKFLKLNFPRFFHRKCEFSKCSNLGCSLLKLLQFPLVHTATLVDQVSSGGGFAAVDMADEDDVNVSLFSHHSCSSIYKTIITTRIQLTLSLNVLCKMGQAGKFSPSL